MKERAFGSIVAATVAGLFVVGTAQAKDKAEKAGEKAKPYCATTKEKQSSCKGHGNASCAGQNTKAGEGWIAAKDAAECASKEGVWKEK